VKAESSTANPAVVAPPARKGWLALVIALNAPGLVAFAGYLTSGLISKVLMEWLERPVVHLVIQLLFLFASALAPFTSLLAVPTVGALAATKKLSGRILLLCTLSTLLSLAGAILMQLWWNDKIQMPGVPSR